MCTYSNAYMQIHNGQPHLVVVCMLAMLYCHFRHQREIDRERERDNLLYYTIKPSVPSLMTCVCLSLGNQHPHQNMWFSENLYVVVFV